MIVERMTGSSDATRQVAKSQLDIRRGSTTTGASGAASPLPDCDSATVYLSWATQHSRATLRRLAAAQASCALVGAERAGQASISASTSSDTSALAYTFCTSSESSRASISRNTLRAPSASSGTSTLGRNDASAES